MRLLIVGLLLVAAPSAASAQCRSAPECLARLGLGRVDPVVAAITGAVAAPLVLGLGAATALRYYESPPAPPAGVVVEPLAPSRPRLALIPSPQPHFRHNPPEHALPPEPGVVRFNDAAATAVAVAGGAAILTSVIVGIAKH
jgi:hypothetical protein